jgi:hypothetical protein
VRHARRAGNEAASVGCRPGNRAARSGVAALLAGLLMFGVVLGHRPTAAAAAVPARSAAPGLPAAGSLKRAGVASAITTVVSHVFTALATGAGKSLAQVIANDNPALGWLLPAAAQRELLHRHQLEQVNESLHSLQRQLASTQEQIARDGFGNLVAHTAQVRGWIKEAWGKLDKLTKRPLDGPDAAQDAETLRAYIAKRLLDAPETLNAVLAPDVPLATDLLESASRLVAHRDRFFGPKSSAEVASVYTYFATYQAQLAVLLQNYYHATPGALSPTGIRDSLAGLQSNIEAQAKSLKPPVPENTVIDTQTREMWTANFPTGPNAPAREVKMGTIATIRYEDQPAPKYHYVLLKPAGPTAIAGLPFANWKLPDVHRFKGLFDKRQGVSPLDWLVKGGFDRSFLEAGDGLKWMDETPHVNIFLVISSMDVRRFSVRTGEMQSVPVTWGTQTDGWRHWFNTYDAGLMYYRTIPEAEKYWW